MAKHLPAMQEAWVRSLGQEDPLQKETATDSNILAWKILWRRLAAYSSKGCKGLDTTEQLNTTIILG